MNFAVAPRWVNQVTELVTATLVTVGVEGVGLGVVVGLVGVEVELLQAASA